MGLVVRKWDQCSRQEVVKGEQPFFVFLQALGRFWILRLVTGDGLSRKLPEPLCSVGARYISTDQLLSLALDTFRAFYSRILAVLCTRARLLSLLWAIFFLQGDPES
jgi:hypothetical protein